MTNFAYQDFPTPRFFSIASGEPFLPSLANGLFAALPDPAALASAEIYLPTRRAVRSFQEILLTRSSKNATLLPSIRALGDVDEDEIIAFSASPADEAALPPSIDSAKRQVALASLIAARDKAFRGQENWPAAIATAQELGKLLDSLHTEEIPADRLREIVPDHLAVHWKDSLKFLEILIGVWPDFLDSHHVMEPAARRIALIKRLNQRWKKTPPQHPVIIAGTTGSTPAVARLMATIAEAPAGAVILPGLDLEASERVWTAVDDSHPQSGMKRLLTRLDTDRDAVRPWGEGTISNAVQTRTRLLSVALQPASTSDDWRRWADSAQENAAAFAEALADVELVEAANEEEEAAAIALKFRETIETPDKTAILVTPDRDLARRVSLKMRRWGVRVDDSGGVPLANTSLGGFLRVLAIWLGEPDNPVALFDVLDHPMTRFGLGAADFVRVRTVFDLGARGPRTKTVDLLLARCREQAGWSDACENVAVQIQRAVALFHGPTQSLVDRLRTHLEIAESFAADDGASGAERLWRGEIGETAADALAKLHQALSDVSIDGDYAAIFRQLIAGATTRPMAGAHPRIAILGPLEARLQNADQFILGGLNEGVWPQDAPLDPFLSRGMRAALGLPSPESRIGLAAHDFFQAACANSVMITRSERAAGKPTKPARWLVRLKNILKGAMLDEKLNASDQYAAWAAMLDAPERQIRIAPPEPKPPVRARPKSLFVTRIETLIRDPYSIYARYVLKLRKLDRLDEPFGPRHAGSLYHDVFENYVAAGGGADINDIFRQSVAASGFADETLLFENERAAIILASFQEWHATQSERASKTFIEQTGKLTFQIAGENFELGARADRIAITENGVEIIDYKTGKPPTVKQQQTSFKPQLALTGVLARKGGFDPLGPANVDALTYIRFRHDGSPPEQQSVRGDSVQSLLNDTEENFQKLIGDFFNPNTPYLSQPRPEYLNEYGDYDHLARRLEIVAAGSDE